MVRKRRTLRTESLETRTVLSGTPMQVPVEIIENVPVQASTSSAQIGDITIFVGSTIEEGRELFRLDADGSISLLSDIRPGQEDSDIRNWTQIGDHVYFEANDGSGRSGYRTNGTVSGTELLVESQGQGASDFVAIDNTLYYNSGGLKYRPLSGTGESGSVPGSLLATINDRVILRESNGPGTGTIQLQTFRANETVQAISNETFGSRITTIGILGDQLLFVGSTPDDGNELWLTDGSPMSAQKLEIRPGPEGAEFDSNGIGFVRIGDTYYFAANDGVSGGELWRTDGTEVGTSMVRDIRVGPEGSNPGAPSANNTSRSSIATLNESVLFLANDGTTGVELWTSDGTEDGTRLVKDIHTGPADSGGTFTHAGRLLSEVRLISTDDGSPSEPTNLWVTDGTEAGTFAFKKLLPADGSIEHVGLEIVEVAGNWYFPVKIDQQGWELWKSDGTPTGTGPVTETRLEFSRYRPRIVGTIDDELIYGYDNRFDDQAEIWKTDGTEAGTILLGVQPYRFETTSSVPFSLAFADDDQMYLSNFDADNTWVTDGTPDGTQVINLLRPNVIPFWTPGIESVSSQPGNAEMGDSITLTATGVTDPDTDLVGVQFFRDIDDDAHFDASIDELLGDATASSDGWILNVSTDRWTTGSNGVFAIASDEMGLTSTCHHVVELATPAAAPDGDFIPVAGSIQIGTVTGELGNLESNDNRYQTITEELITVDDQAMQHTWEFDLPSGSSATFAIEAYHNTPGEEVWVSYTLDGNHWQTMLTVAKTSDDGALQTYQLPDGTSGRLQVRARDSIRTGDADPTTLLIDRMFVAVTDIEEEEPPTPGGPGPQPETSEVYANAERTRTGIVISGSIDDIQDADGVAQVLQEAGVPDGRIIHEWLFDVPVDADTATVAIDAYHDSLDGEVFWLNYSTDGSNFKNLLTVDSQDTNGDTLRRQLPDSARGTVWLKFVDSQPTEDENHDQLLADRLVIETTAASTDDPADPPVPSPPIFVASSDETRFGSVSGGLPTTYVVDGRSQILAETGSSASLIHRWTFMGLPTGAKLTLLLDATHDSTNERFWVNYSTDGDNWRNALTIGPQQPDSQSRELLALTETLYVDVRDANRTDDFTANTLWIDRLVIVATPETGMSTEQP